MMKKIIYITFIVLCLTGCKKKLADNIETVVDEKLSEKQSEEKQDNQEINKLIVSEQVKGEDFFNLEPLAENETLEIKFNDELYSFLIYKISNNQKILYYNINHGWHVIEISFDKKKVLFALNINHDYYLLDGNTGKISFINSFNNICCPSKDFKYLIRHTWNEHWPSLEVIYMDTLDVKFIIPWDVPIRNAMRSSVSEDGGYCRTIMYNKESMEELSKSLKKHNLEIIIDEGEFDCIVYLMMQEGEGYYGYGYFNAESGKLITHMVDLYNGEYY